ncbi:MAG: DUF2961 domain-containing protein [FCB group bacterium]|jgi:hypothetical protein|nr:DUF2961 domain-containing protein [FCB group bacterium]
MKTMLTALALLILCPLATAQNNASGALDDLIRPQDYRAMRASSSAEDINSNGDDRSIAKGETLVLGELEGPGMITHIWCTVASLDFLHGRNLVLRVYYDGMEKPSVEAPLGDFFGVGHGATVNYTSEVAAVSSYGRARNCWWKMPFQKSARVTVTNESATHDTISFYYYVDWRKMDSLPADTPYFHAHYRQETPAQPGHYVILDTKGRGHYAGTVLSTLQMETGWFGEGDDFIYIDGETTPSLRGTGTEDYFGDAWGFRPFSTPYYGVTLYDGVFPGDRVTAYRWHVQDPIPFKESLKVTIEHRGSVYTDDGTKLASSNERPDWVSSVAYWYQTPAVGFDAPLAPAAERTPPHRMLFSSDMTWRASQEDKVEKGDYQITYRPTTSDAWIEFDFDVPQDGTYQLNAALWYGLSYGVYQPMLDGKPIGEPVNFNNGADDYVWFPLDLHDLKAGKHVLRFEGRGDAPNMRPKAPRGNEFSITYINLLRLEDMKGYHELMNKLLAERKAKEAK